MAAQPRPEPAIPPASPAPLIAMAAAFRQAFASEPPSSMHTKSLFGPSRFFGPKTGPSSAVNSSAAASTVSSTRNSGDPSTLALESEVIGTAYPSSDNAAHVNPAVLPLTLSWPQSVTPAIQRSAVALSSVPLPAPNASTPPEPSGASFVSWASSPFNSSCGTAVPPSTVAPAPPTLSTSSFRPSPWIVPSMAMHPSIPNISGQSKIVSVATNPPSTWNGLSFGNTVWSPFAARGLFTELDSSASSVAQQINQHLDFQTEALEAGRTHSSWAGFASDASSCDSIGKSKADATANTVQHHAAAMRPLKFVQWHKMPRKSISAAPFATKQLGVTRNATAALKVRIAYTNQRAVWRRLLPSNSLLRQGRRHSKLSGHKLVPRRGSLKQTHRGLKKSSIAQSKDVSDTLSEDGELYLELYNEDPSISTATATMCAQEGSLSSISPGCSKQNAMPEARNRVLKHRTRRKKPRKAKHKDMQLPLTNKTVSSTPAKLQGKKFYINPLGAWRHILPPAHQPRLSVRVSDAGRRMLVRHLDLGIKKTAGSSVGVDEETRDLVLKLHAENIAQRALIKRQEETILRLIASQESVPYD